MKPHPASNLGTVLARMLGEVVIQAHGATVQQGQDARIEANTRFMEHIEGGLAPILEEYFGKWIDDPNMPDELKALIKPMVGPTHQFDVLLQIVGIISALISGVFGLGAPYLQPFLNQLYSTNRFRPLDPALAADGVERGRWPMEYGDQWAAMSGIEPGAFTDMVNLVGEPPGLEQMLSLWRRGLLGEGTLDEMIAFSRVLTQWTPYVKLLAYSSMTPGDALEAALKGVLTHDAALDLFEKGGGLAEQFDVLLSTTGNPIGVEAANQLFNHGLIDDTQLTQVILHSRVNPQFEAMAKLLRFRYLQPYQIAEALKAGAVTPEQATGWMLEDGFPADQVAAFVAYGAGSKNATGKALTEAQVASMYETGIISKGTAEASLVALDYTAVEADMLLSLYESRRELAMANAAVSQVRKIYLAGRIDDTAASSDLAELGIDAEAITQYLKVWKVEAGAELKELSAAQIGSMAKKGLLTYDQATARWEAMGYSSDDAGLLAANYGGTPPAGSPAAETAATSGTSTSTGA